MCQDGRCVVLLFAYLILCASDLCIGHKMCLPKSLNTYHGNGCRGAKVCVLRSQWRNSKSFWVLYPLKYEVNFWVVGLLLSEVEKWLFLKGLFCRNTLQNGRL